MLIKVLKIIQDTTSTVNILINTDQIVNVQPSISPAEDLFPEVVEVKMTNGDAFILANSIDSFHSLTRPTSRYQQP